MSLVSPPLCQLLVKKEKQQKHTITSEIGEKEGEECTSCLCKQLDTNKISDLASQSIPSSVLKSAASKQDFISLMISIKVISTWNEKVTNQIAVPPSHDCCLGMHFIDCLSFLAWDLLLFNVLIIAGEDNHTMLYCKVHFTVKEKWISSAYLSIML